jgi:hypothetical protein
MNRYDIFDQQVPKCIDRATEHFEARLVWVGTVEALSGSEAIKVAKIAMLSRWPIVREAAN